MMLVEVKFAAQSTEPVMAGDVPTHTQVGRPARVRVPAVLLPGVGLVAVPYVVRGIVSDTAIPASSVGISVGSVTRKIFQSTEPVMMSGVPRVQFVPKRPVSRNVRVLFVLVPGVGIGNVARGISAKSSPTPASSVGIFSKSASASASLCEKVKAGLEGAAALVIILSFSRPALLSLSCFYSFSQIYPQNLKIILKGVKIKLYYK